MYRLRQMSFEIVSIRLEKKEIVAFPDVSTVIRDLTSTFSQTLVSSCIILNCDLLYETNSCLTMLVSRKIRSVSKSLLINVLNGSITVQDSVCVRQEFSQKHAYGR